MSDISVNRFARLVGGACVATLVLAAPAHAIDRFVATTGVDLNNDCSATASPCRTVAQALGQASSGDTINVSAGRYQTNLLIDFSTDLTFLGGWDSTFTNRDPTKQETVLNGRRKDRVWTIFATAGDAITVTIDGFTVTRGLADTNGPTPSGESGPSFSFRDGGGLIARSGGGSINLTLSHMVFSWNRAMDGGGGLSLAAYDDGVTRASLDSVKVIHNHAGYLGGGINPETVVGYGVAAGATLDVELSNCVVAQNVATVSGAIWAQQNSRSVTNPPSSATLTIINSTIVKNRSHNLVGTSSQNEGGAVALIRAGETGDTFVTTLSNTVLWGNFVPTGFGDLQMTDSPPQTGLSSITVNADHNDIGAQAIDVGTFNDLGGDISVSPRLFRLFRLRRTSPLIDAGTCTGAPLTDFEGDPRPSGSGCDIGADEFQF